MVAHLKRLRQAGTRQPPRRISVGLLGPGGRASDGLTSHAMHDHFRQFQGLP